MGPAAEDGLATGGRPSVRRIRQMKAICSFAFRAVDRVRGNRVSRDRRLRPARATSSVGVLALAMKMTEAIDSSSVRLRHRYGMIIAAAVAMSGLALSTLLVTGPQFGMVWDESFVVKKERLLNIWFERYVTRSESAPQRSGFTKLILDRYWLFSRAEPRASTLLRPDWPRRLEARPNTAFAPLEAYRFGPMLLTSLTVGVIYYHLATRRRTPGGHVAAVLLVAMPRSFAHAHYAHYDMPMTCLWLIAQVAFVASLESRWWAVPFGMALGLAAATKFTGLFAVIPAVVGGVHRDSSTHDQYSAAAGDGM